MTRINIKKKKSFISQDIPVTEILNMILSNIKKINKEINKNKSKQNQ